MDPNNEFVWNVVDYSVDFVLLVIVSRGETFFM